MSRCTCYGNPQSHTPWPYVQPPPLSRPLCLGWCTASPSPRSLRPRPHLFPPVLLPFLSVFPVGQDVCGCLQRRVSNLVSRLHPQFFGTSRTGVLSDVLYPCPLTVPFSPRLRRILLVSSPGRLSLGPRRRSPSTSPEEVHLPHNPSLDMEAGVTSGFGVTRTGTSTPVEPKQPTRGTNPTHHATPFPWTSSIRREESCGPHVRRSTDHCTWN